MSFYNYQILVHRPFLFLATLLDTDAETQAKFQGLSKSASEICRESAFEIISLCQLYRQHYTLKCIVFMLAHFLLNACTIHIADYWNEESPQAASSASSALDECIEILEEMKDVWEIAQNIIMLVNQLKESHDNGDTTTSAEILPQRTGVIQGDKDDSLEAVERYFSDGWGSSLPHQDVWNMALMPYQANEIGILNWRFQ